MGGKNDSPDYRGAALEQGEANKGVVRDQTYANRPTQFTPYGFSAWNPYQYQDPASGENVTRWENVQGLTPELQDILNKQVGLQGARTDIAGGMTNRMAEEFGSPINYEGINPMDFGPESQFTMPERYSGPEIGDPERLRARAEDARYGKATSRLDPAFASKRNALEIKLRNQGIGPEDAAWKAQMGQLAQQETDAYGQAQYDAVTGGMQEAGQMFGQDLSRRQQGVGEAQQNFGQNLAANMQNYSQAMQGSRYANAIRQQQMTEEMQKRGFSLNEINALLSGQQVQSPQMPSFMGAGQAQPAPIYRGAVDQGNFDMAQNQQLMDAIGGGASAASLFI